MNHLTRLRLQGYKTFIDLELEPGPLNVLIGANGVGKSNLISFFRMLGWMMAGPTGSLQTHVALGGGASKLLHDGPARTSDLRAELSLATDLGASDYAFTLTHAADDTLIFTKEAVRFSRRDRATLARWADLDVGQRESGLIRRAEHDKTARTVRSLLQRCVVYQFHNTGATARLKQKWRLDDSRYLKEDAGNLAPVLVRLRDDAPETYRRLAQTIRLILPFFDDFELNPDEGAVLLAWRERESDCLFTASQASDGMLRTLSLLTLLAQPEADLPDILFIDEPELGLHPYAISLVAAMLRSISRTRQVFVATQSVTFLNEMRPEDVLVLERPARGTELKRLDPQALEAWLAEYALGEAWTMNLLGGRPQGRVA